MTLAPSDKALVPFVSVDNMMKLVHHTRRMDASPQNWYIPKI